MAVFEYYQIFFIIPLSVFSLLFFKIRKQKKRSAPTNWPIVGMLPAVIENIHRFHDYTNEILKESGGTFEFKGPLFGNMDMVFTCDPANIQHIFSKKFSNYPKGPEFRKIFEILGDGIFRADFELWELHRRTTLSLMSSEKFYSSLERSVWQKVETGLIPVFDNFLEQGSDFDMQHIIQRFAFDNICQLMLNHDPGSLSPDLPDIRCERALSDALEPLFHRHILPETIWKLQKWLKIGNEKKLLEAWKAFDDFIYPRISLEDNNSDNIFEAFTKAYQESENIEFSGDLKHFLRDTFLNLLVAGRDSLSTGLTWFFWLIAKNPSVEIKIREEIETVLQIKQNEKWRYFNVEESHKLVYLQAALYETIRLFPPIALEHKVPIEPDILPGGNVYVDQNTKVIISFYSTGRMESVWGKDCLEFKPDRWILPGGGVRHESAFKFPVFNAGPRTCLGKKMAIIEMKMVAAFIVYHFQVHVIEGHPVSPRDAIILHAKHGLRVRLSRIRHGIKD